MYMADKEMCIRDATIWIERNACGNWAPIDQKCIDYIKWFHDGVIAKRDTGGFRIVYRLLIV